MIASSGFSGTTLLRGALGMAVVLGIAWLCSTDRKRIDWRLTVSGLLLQIGMALAILYVPFVGLFFEYIGKVFVKLVGFTQEGVAFLLGPYASKTTAWSF